MPPFGYHAMPINIPSTASVDPPHTPPTMALTQNLPGIPSLSSYSPSLSSSSYTSSSSSLASSWNPAPWTDWSKAHSGVLSAMGQGSYYANFLDQASGNYHGSGSPPDGLGTFSSSPATSPGLDARDITSEAMDVSPGQYSAIHSGSLVQRQRQKYERNDDQIGVQGTYDRRFTCTFDNCGKSFSGEWEKTRHIKSLHYPPSIGCRDCNYKQSRKDLFSEHCKKRHPGESIEELMVHLVHNWACTKPRGTMKVKAVRTVGSGRIRGLETACGALPARLDCHFGPGFRKP
jgi:hypothetical protein